jgi:chromate transporter
MIDGLALGETTPGPLIRGLHRRLDPAGLRPRSAAARGHCGGRCGNPFHLPANVPVHPLRRPPGRGVTHGDLKFTAPLTGITAAVAGIAVNLAVFFA